VPQYQCEYYRSTRPREPLSKVGRKHSSISNKENRKRLDRIARRFSYSGIAYHWSAQFFCSSCGIQAPGIALANCSVGAALGRAYV
jgi:hypothetical protein